MSLGQPSCPASSARPPAQPAAPAQAPLRATWRVDVSDVVPWAGRHALAVALVLPRAHPGGAGIVLLVCLPGGFLSRRYFDLDPAGAARYSFAEAMTQRGFGVLAIDHLGIGESSKPEPIEAGYAFGVEVVARANQRALERALERLAQGDPATGIPATRCRATVGVGHSMGSALTVEQQAAARPHAALVLFSFTTRGVPAFLNDDQRAFANDPARARRELGALAKRSFGSPYPARANDSPENRRAAFGVGTAPPFAEALLHDASSDLLGLGGLLSMIPGGYAPSAAAIDVPVYILVGDHDLHGEQGLREELPNAPSVTTRTLADCWHCHFVANTRETIWQAVPDWLETTLGR